jgi:hypothetical protein
LTPAPGALASAPRANLLLVGFLDELKDQTRALRAVESVAPDAEALARNRRLANGACRLAHDYWKELCEHLNLIRSPSAARYVLAGREPLEGLVCANFRVLPQLKLLPGGEPLYESVLLGWQATGDALQRIEKEHPHDIDRLRAALMQAGIQPSEGPVRNAASGRLQGTAFQFKPVVLASVRVTPLLDSGKVRLSFINIDQLERVDGEYPAAGLRARLLDEIGRWIVGQPHRVLEYAGNIKRFQH